MNAGKRELNSRAFLVKEEFEIERTPDEYIKWYNRKLENFDEALNGEIRFRKGLFKQFIGESSYLTKFLQKYTFSHYNVRVKHIINNQSFDVEIIYHEQKQNPDLKFLEITDSSMNKEEHYRMEKLHKEGSVNAWGKVTRTGTKNKNPKTHVADDCISDDERLEEIDKVTQALNKKLEKCSNYQKCTGLIIGVDDYRLFKDGDVEHLDNLIRTNPSKLTGFSSIFFVGSKNMFLSYDIKSLSSKRTA